MTQILLVIALVACVGWLIYRARERSQQKYEELAPAPPDVNGTSGGESGAGKRTSSSAPRGQMRAARQARREERLAQANGASAEPTPAPDETEGAPSLEPVPEPDEADPDVVELDPQPDEPEPVVAEWDSSQMESELEQIYVRVGKPDAVEEAKGKVRDLARERSADGSWSEDEALYKAYEVSLAEHREYLAAQGQA